VRPHYLSLSQPRVSALDATLWTVLVLCLACGGFVLGGYYFTAREVPSVPSPGHVVRVLDIVIRDSNTTNRRQRFECRPTDASPTTTKESK
jgi:hypothetical protein